MTVFDILAKRNADKLRAVRADGASIRYHLRMDGSEAGVIDVFELFNGVSLAFNSIPQGTASWDDIEPHELQVDWCLRRSIPNLTMASASEMMSLPCMTSGLESAP